MALVKPPTTDISSEECGPKAFKASDLWSNLYPNTLLPQHQQIPWHR